jgi:parvulin-like peptidyl-prolyl isomerase
LTGAITWEEAVQQVSSCPENSDLGFFRRGVMVEPFEEAAFKAEENTITDIVETQLGWHIIQVLSHLPEEPALFEEIKEDLLSELQIQRDREAIEAYVDERKQYFK